MAQKPGDGKYLTYEEWKVEWAKSEEARKQAEAEAEKLSEGEKKREEEQQKRVLAQAALELAKSYEDEKFDQGTTKDPVFVVIGLDKDTLLSEQTDHTGRRNAKFVSLHGHNVYEYFRQNCPVREGPDPARQQTGYDGSTEIRHAYECMAGIYVGRNTKGKMCYTFFDKNGQVTHINDNIALYPFSPGNNPKPYSGYRLPSSRP